MVRIDFSRDWRIVVAGEGEAANEMVDYYGALEQMFMAVLHQIPDQREHGFELTLSLAIDQESHCRHGRPGSCLSRDIASAGGAVAPTLWQSQLLLVYALALKKQRLCRRECGRTQK